jgi:tRNA wybutosine-synthesizing protein 1
MAQFINSLLSGFSNIMTVSSDVVSKEDLEDNCCSKEEGGCCKDDQPKTNDGCCQSDPSQSCGCSNEPVEIDQVKILYSTLTGTTKTLASEIEAKITANSQVNVQKISVMDITEYDNDNLLQETAVCVFVLSTYNVEGPLDW